MLDTEKVHASAEVTTEQFAVLSYFPLQASILKNHRLSQPNLVYSVEGWGGLKFSFYIPLWLENITQLQT